jgi:hypothetical protein
MHTVRPRAARPPAVGRRHSLHSGAQVNTVPRATDATRPLVAAVAACWTAVAIITAFVVDGAQLGYRFYDTTKVCNSVLDTGHVHMGGRWVTARHQRSGCDRGIGGVVDGRPWRSGRRHRLVRRASDRGRACQQLKQRVEGANADGVAASASRENDALGGRQHGVPRRGSRGAAAATGRAPHTRAVRQ